MNELASKTISINLSPKSNISSNLMWNTYENGFDRLHCMEFVLKFFRTFPELSWLTDYFNYKISNNLNYSLVFVA